MNLNGLEIIMPTAQDIITNTASNEKEQYIDLYLLQSFKKTPLIQIFNKLTEVGVVQKYLQINERNNAISKLKNLLILIKII